MKVARHIVEGRRKKLADLLQRHRYLSVQELCREIGVSEATMRRDLVWLQQHQMIMRTHGGALADFNLRFPSFRQRRTVNAEAKRQIASRAYALLRPEMTIFLDAGTTVFNLAELIRETPIRPLTCVTSSLPTADLLAEVQGISVHLLGGQLLHRQSVLVGRGALQSTKLWRFDLAVFSAQGMTADGLWNSQTEVVELQHALLAGSARHVFLVDSSKIGRTTAHFLLPWDRVDGLFTDATQDTLVAAGIPSHLTVSDHLAIAGTASSALAEESEESVPVPNPEPSPDLTFPVSLL